MTAPSSRRPSAARSAAPSAAASTEAAPTAAWHERYLIGHPRIDREHRLFFDIVAAFSEGCRQRLSRDALISLLEEVLLFAKFHFRSEENVMQALGFAGMEAHRALHEQLVQRLGRVIVGVKLGRYPPEEIDAFLVQWLVRHVTHEDARITGGGPVAV